VLKRHTRSGELVLTNDKAVWSPHTMAYYSGRDVQFDPMPSLQALDKAIQKRAPQSIALVLVERGPEAEILSKWLSLRCPFNELQIPGKPLERPAHIFYISDSCFRKSAVSL